MARTPALPGRTQRRAPPIALCAHDERRPFQFIHHGFAIRHLAELGPMLAQRILKFSQTELHLQDRRSEGFAETVGLLRGPPVRKVREGAGCVCDNHVLHPILEAVCPGKDALHTGRVWRDHADGGKSDASCSDVLIHRVEPVRGNLPGPGSHVCEDDRSAAVEMIDEGIKTCRGVHVDFGHGDVEEMLQQAASLILSIEIEQRNGDLVGPEPLGQGDYNASFADPALAAHGENNALRMFRQRSPPLVRVSGSFSRKTKRAGFAFRISGFALRAAMRSTAGESFAADSRGGSSNCARL